MKRVRLLFSMRIKDMKARARLKESSGIDIGYTELFVFRTDDNKIVQVIYSDVNKEIMIQEIENLI
jgi:ribosomal protein L18